MKSLVSIQFKSACKLYDFDSCGLLYGEGDSVVAETERGLAIGTVVLPNHDVEDKDCHKDLKRIVRKTNISDIDRAEQNLEREKVAWEYCRQRIRDRDLAMKLISVEYYFDASKAMFFFTAEQRVDFRELVKDLAQRLHTRIEMRQMGIRDVAKTVGGLGPCGLAICCSQFLREFAPVSVKMVKDQCLSMNPAKVSGSCGRLMCCLAYEHETYAELLKGIPKRGKRVVTEQGIGKVIDVNAMKSEVTVRLDVDGKTFTTQADKVQLKSQVDNAKQTNGQ